MDSPSTNPRNDEKIRQITFNGWLCDRINVAFAASTMYIAVMNCHTEYGHGYGKLSICIESQSTSKWDMPSQYWTSKRTLVFG